MATGYGLDSQGIGVRVLIEAKFFFSSRRSDRLCGPPSLLSKGYRGSFPSGKAARSWTWLSSRISGFEVLTVEIMKSISFWDITLCSPSKVRYFFRLTDYSACHLISSWYLAHLILGFWRWRRYVPSKRRLTFNVLHGVIFQKIMTLQ
jgi:hypothetical protein